jgi:hypothetical protein
VRLERDGATGRIEIYVDGSESPVLAACEKTRSVPPTRTEARPRPIMPPATRCGCVRRWKI